MNNLFLKEIIDLLSSLTTGEIISLIFMIGGLIFYCIKWYLNVTQFVKDTAKEEIKKESEHTDSEKIKDQLLDLKNDVTDLLDISKKYSNDVDKNINEQILLVINKINEIKDIFNSKLIVLNDQIDDVYKNINEKLENANDIHKELMNTLNILKISIDRLETTIKDMSPENKLLHQETLRQIQIISKDLATLQGTIIGNMTSSRFTLK
jgi:hypothetical protein